MPVVCRWHIPDELRRHRVIPSNSRIGSGKVEFIYALSFQFSSPVSLTASGPHGPPFCGKCIWLVVYGKLMCEEFVSIGCPRLSCTCNLKVTHIFAFKPRQIFANRFTKYAVMATTRGKPIEVIVTIDAHGSNTLSMPYAYLVNGCRKECKRVQHQERCFAALPFEP